MKVLPVRSVLSEISTGSSVGSKVGSNVGLNVGSNVGSNAGSREGFASQNCDKLSELEK